LPAITISVAIRRNVRPAIQSSAAQSRACARSNETARREFFTVATAISDNIAGGDEPEGERKKSD